MPTIPQLVVVESGFPRSVVVRSRPAKDLPSNIKAAATPGGGNDDDDGENEG